MSMKQKQQIPINNWKPSTNSKAASKVPTSLSQWQKPGSDGPQQIHVDMFEHIKPQAPIAPTVYRKIVEDDPKPSLWSKKLKEMLGEQAEEIN